MARPRKHDTQHRIQLFIAAGLSDKEALLYDTLLTAGAAAGAMLEKSTGLKKNTYALLRSLITKKLVTEVRSGTKTLYQAAPPAALMDLVAATERAVGQTKTAIAGILPALTSQYALSVGKPTVRYFEGEDGLKEVFADIYAPKDEPVWGAVDLESADRAFPKHIADTLIPLRVENNLTAYTLLADSPAAQDVHAKDAEQLRVSELIDKAAFPMPAEIDVYGDKIAMLSFERGRFIGVIIENEAFATTLKSIIRRNFRPGSAPQSAPDR